MEYPPDKKEQKYVEGILPPLGLRKAKKMKNQALAYTHRKKKSLISLLQATSL